MLPSKQATGAFTLPKNRIKDEDHWSLFQDAPRQALHKALVSGADVSSGPKAANSAA